jgi:LacI family transcriptional regulator
MFNRGLPLMANAAPKKLTLAQIALKAQVPVTSVMQIVLGLGKAMDSNEFTRIKQVLDEVDTVILSNSSNTAGLKHIGIVVHGTSRILNLDFQGVILDTLLREADPKRYLLVLHYYLLGDLSNVDGFVEHIDGMIMLGGVSSEIAEKCRAIGRPYVLIDPSERDSNDNNGMILVNNEVAIQDLIHHLMALGHRKIGMVTGELLHGVARERLAAYHAALQAAHLPQRAEWVLESTWTEESGYNCGKELLNLPERPSAILAANDLNALGVIRAAHEMGLLVGSDVSVTGFDDLPMAGEDHLQLTTIRQPLREMARMAMDMIARLLQGETLAEPHITVKTELIVRSTTGQAPSD